MPVTTHDSLELTAKDIDDIIGWHEALGIWADDLDELVKLKAAKLQEGSQGEAVVAHNFRGRIERLLAACWRRRGIGNGAMAFGSRLAAAAPARRGDQGARTLPGMLAWWWRRKSS